jgi:uncharacterized protein YoxC
MTTVLTIAAIAVLVIFVFVLFLIVAGIFALRKLEKFLKGHKTTLQTVEMSAGLVTTLLGLLPTIVAAVIGLRKAFTTKTK